MSKAVELAAAWVNTMLRLESRGAGDSINAMRRLSVKHGIPYSLLFALKYKPPKDLYVSAFEKLENAYEKQLRGAVSALDHERKLTEAKTGIGARIVAAANALDREEM